MLHYKTDFFNRHLPMEGKKKHPYFFLIHRNSFMLYNNEQNIILLYINQQLPALEIPLCAFNARSFYNEILCIVMLTIKYHFWCSSSSFSKRLLAKLCSDRNESFNYERNEFHYWLAPTDSTKCKSHFCQYAGISLQNWDALDLLEEKSNAFYCKAVCFPFPRFEKVQI